MAFTPGVCFHGNAQIWIGLQGPSRQNAAPKNLGSKKGEDLSAPTA
jgi:hypothetical protein